MNLTLSTLATALDAEVLNSADVSVTSTSFDSRQVQPGALFVPLVAENDGHDYVESAIAHGANVTLWQADHRATAPTTIPVVLVPDTLTAYQALATFYLQQVAPKVVAVSGSNGKTTTKDFIAAIGAKGYRTVKTPANFNNEIGVPATILGMSDDTELLVIEFGMDRPGDLTKLSTMIHPDIAVLTMIGEAHIEFFKTRDRIADGKMEIVNGLNPDGVLVYNGDEPLLVDRVGAQDTLKGTTFGLNPRNDLFATEIELHTESASFKTSVAEARFSIPLSGRYNIANALAAISVGRLLGISFEDMANALSAADITQNRTEWLTASNGARILSDVYNSNPTAAKEVLAMFSQVPTTGKRLVVLGDMLELGEAGPELHASLADSLNLGAIAEVFLVGDIMRHLGDRLHAKFQPEHIHQFAKTDLDPLAEAISKTLQPEDIILLKGSHGIHLEGIVSVLVG